MRLKHAILRTAVVLSLTICFTLGLAQDSDALDVYVMDSGNQENNDLVTTALTDAGHNATLGKPYYQQDGNESLSDFDVVVLLDNYNWNFGIIPSSGQTEILNFVSGGGGLVTSEWWVWSYSSAPVGALSPVVSTGAYRSISPITYTQETLNPILNAGVASSFTFVADNIGGTESLFTAKPAATVFYASDYQVGAGGLVGWDYNAGRVISFSTLVGNEEMKNSNYHNLFVNAVEWAADTFGRCEGDFDDDGDVDGSDLALFAADFGRTDCEQGAPCEGDFDHDNDVDGTNLSLFASDFGRTDCP